MLVCGAALAEVLPFTGNLCMRELSNSKQAFSFNFKTNSP
jgi:hypothetical protein